MNWYTIFYLFSLADGLNIFAGWLAGIGTGITAILIVVFISSEGFVGDKNDLKLWRTWVWRTGLMAFIGWSLVIAVPTKSNMLMIIAGGTVGNFLQSDSSASKLPADLTKYLHTAIQSEIKDMEAPIELKKAFGTVTPKDEFLDKVKNLTKEEIIEQLKGLIAFEERSKEIIEQHKNDTTVK